MKKYIIGRQSTWGLLTLVLGFQLLCAQAPPSATLAELQAQQAQLTQLSALNDQQIAAATAFGPYLKSESARVSTAIAALSITTADTFGKRFGPTWKDLNPGVADTRPTTYSTADIAATKLNADGTKQTFIRADPYNVGIEDGDLSDYWSCSGQVLYVPNAGDKVTFPKTWGSTDTVTTGNPGIDRIATFAMYNGAIATSPRLDKASFISRPDHFRANESRYAGADQPVGMVRTVAGVCNEALVISQNGILMSMGTQTSREGEAWPLPVLTLPADKKPTGGIAVTTSNEFALITVTDTTTGKGQLAVVALEGRWIKYHTWPYMGLYNQGSWSDFKLLGYIDLSIAAPDNVAAASNGSWKSPGDTAGKSISQILLASGDDRWSLLNGSYAWLKIVATKGYAIVSSKSEGKAVIVDLTPLFASVRDAYLNKYDATMAARGPLPAQFPQAFDLLATSQPKEVLSIAIAKPTALLAGQQIDRWSPDFQKAYIASEAGNITIVDTSSLLARFDFEQSHALGVIGSFKVGRNPVSMCFARFGEAGLPLIPAGRAVDPLNNLFWVACRGERRLDLVVTANGSGQVVRSIQDSRLEDPVGLGMADRAPMLTVTDYTGHKIHSFRVGGVAAHSGKFYGCGPDGKAAYEYSGSLTFNGAPFAVCSVNVN